MNCPNCKNYIDDDSKFCRFCGAEFLDEGEEAPDAVPMESVISITTEDEPVKTKRTSFKGIAKVVGAVIVILVICIGIVFLVNSVGKIQEPVTDASGDIIHKGLGIGTVDISVRDIDGTAREITAYRSLVTPSDILDEYTQVMNKLKTDAPGFTTVRYQNLPVEHQNLGAVAKLVLPIIEKNVTSKSAAEAVTYASGSANKLPLLDSASGCLLTDATKIKSAYSEVLDDGRCKLVITLHDEQNPIVSAEGSNSQSAVAAMFSPYEVGGQISAIAELALSDIDFNYTDCTVTVIYEKSSKKVESVKQVMNIDISANAYVTTIKARIVDITEYDTFNY